MKLVGFTLLICAGFIEILDASPPSEATPWTKSFLETRVSGSFDHYTISVQGDRFQHVARHKSEGGVYATGSFYPDWEFDIGIQGKSFSTRKFFARAEKQLYSDLEGDLIAATALLQASTCGFERCHSPVFFEMARNCAEGGIGLGRHLVIQKKAYTQVFGYLIGGFGSARARYGRAEVGFQQVFSLQHFIRIAFCHLKTFGDDRHSFRGIGTLRTNVNTCEVSYAYRWDSGIETRLTYIRRMFSKSSLRRASAYLVSVSTPMSL